MSPHQASDVSRLAVLFPGQGAQRIGMGSWLFREVPEMREILDSLSAAAGCDIEKLCARGPMSMLSDTRYTQPAMFAVGLAAYLYLSLQGTSASVVAGHSVGEITALCAAGVLSPDVAATLVCERGRLMVSAPGDGQMALIAGLGRAEVQRCCDSCQPSGCVVIAAQNGPADHVVSGDRQAVRTCCAVALAAGARHASGLKTSHAFHSPLMRPCLPGWEAIVGALPMRQASILVIPNVTAQVTGDPQQLRTGLLQQLIQPVEWWSTMRTLVVLGVRTVVTCEPGNYLSSLARRAGLSAVSFADPRKVRTLTADWGAVVT
ncbi:MAG TPA: ACP S-malonyltransferase [Streptosporangiaceae bacterium]|nr:ACP S-malonyltransferase [Streptosporangiaceae bacterium]